MTDKVNSFAPQIWTEIEKSQNILLHCHVGPDEDSYGSTLAFLHVLNSLGKNVTLISGDWAPMKKFSILPGFNLIKNKNFTDINQNDFDLFLVLDCSSTNQITKLDKVEFNSGLKVIIIDHHSTSTNFGKINLVDETYPATSQLLYDLFMFWQVKITPEIAICLFVGIYGDTGGFKYPPVSVETFEIATALVKKYPDFAKVILAIQHHRTPNEIIFEALALNSVKTYFSGKVAVSQVSSDQLSAINFKEGEISTSTVSSNLVTVSDWEIGICLVEKNKDEVGVSLRTRGKYDVAAIAVATGVGGGHPAAAGARLKMPLEQALKFLLSTIQKTYPELGNP